MGLHVPFVRGMSMVAAAVVTASRYPSSRHGVEHVLQKFLCWIIPRTERVNRPSCGTAGASFEPIPIYEPKLVEP